MAILMKLDQVIWITNCCICWLSVLSILFVNCIYDYILTYITQLAFNLGLIVDQIILTWFSHYRLHSSSLTGVAVKPSIQALIWHLDVFINTFINLCILVESYMPPHRMITQLRTVYSKIVHNCYWYTDYMHCSGMNNTLVTRHETWSAYENYVWFTVTSS